MLTTGVVWAKVKWAEANNKKARPSNLAVLSCKVEIKK
jgi:hypothetical protein